MATDYKIGVRILMGTLWTCRQAIRWRFRNRRTGISHGRHPCVHLRIAAAHGGISGRNFVRKATQVSLLYNQGAFSLAGKSSGFLIRRSGVRIPERAWGRRQSNPSPHALRGCVFEDRRASKRGKRATSLCRMDTWSPCAGQQPGNASKHRRVAQW